MDEHESADALSDRAFQRRLEAALAVDPSPEFLARVRTRIASEPASAQWTWRWRNVAAAATMVVVVGSLFFVARDVRKVQSSADEGVTLSPARADVLLLPEATLAAVASDSFHKPSTHVVRVAVPHRRRVTVSTGSPQAFVADDEKRAFLLVLTVLREASGDDEGVAVEPATASDSLAPETVAVAPIEIPPLSIAMQLEGGLQ